MDRMKFEGRMNYFMLTAIRSAKNEDGLISDRDLKAIELMKELIRTAEPLLSTVLLSRVTQVPQELMLLQYQSHLPTALYLRTIPDQQF